MANLMTIIQQSFILALVAMAVYITSRVLKKDDLSVEGSFGLGGAITAVVIEQWHAPFSALIAALIVGACVGACTGILFTKAKMNHLMAGLVTTTACFSIALACASANKLVAHDSTIFSQLRTTIGETIIVGVIAAVILLIVIMILRSQIGILLRAVGENPRLLLHLGKSAHLYYVVGFVLANALTALAGSLFIQWSGFFSITSNVGILVTGLATVMIAELVSPRLNVALLVAAMLYQSVFWFTLQLGVEPMWNNFVKAALMVLLVVIAHLLQRKLRHA